MTLDTAAYEALYAKRADFVITFSAWEGIEAGQRGIPLRTFAFTRLRVPGLLPGGARLRQATGWPASRTLAKAFVVGHGPRVRVRGR